MPWFVELSQKKKEALVCRIISKKKERLSKPSERFILARARLTRLCDYLYELSSRFNRFYEQCPVNNADTVELKRSRTALCVATADAIQLGLGLLGIDTLERL